MRTRLTALLLALILLLPLAPALGEETVEYKQIYDSALEYAAKDLMNKQYLQDAITALNSTGAYEMSRYYM